MASQVEGAVLSDVVLEESEDAHLRSRDQLIVDANQALVIGSVCQKGVGGRMKSMIVGVDEVQVIGVTTASGGTIILGIPQVDGGVVWTDPIAYNGTFPADAQTGVDTTPNGAGIVVSGSAITALTFTFSGATHAGQAWPLIQLDVSAATCEDASVTRTTAGGGGAAQTDEVQEITTVDTGTADGGTYVIYFPHPNGTTLHTTALAYDANLSAINAALDVAWAAADPVVPADSAVMTGTNLMTGNLVLTYSGEVYEGRDWPLATVDADLVVEGSTTGQVTATFAETTKGSPATVGEVAGICLEDVTTLSVYTTEAVFLTRDAVVNVGGLDFHEGNKVDCIEQLEALGIVCREEPA